jgi:hypothetical protein
MKARLFTVFVLAAGLALLLVWSVAAQGPEPGAGKPPGRGSVERLRLFSAHRRCIMG